MVFWNRSRIVAVAAISVILLIGIALPPHLPGVEASEQAPGKQDPSGKDSATVDGAEIVGVDTLQFVANGRPVTNETNEAAGFMLVADRTGAQVAVLAHAGAFVACVRQGETSQVGIPLAKRDGPFSISVRVDLLAGETAPVEISLEGKSASQTLQGDQDVELTLHAEASGDEPFLRLTARGSEVETTVRWREIRIETAGKPTPLGLALQPNQDSCPPPEHPPLRPAMEQVLIEWDWRMQDGIDTPRFPATYAAAVERTFQRGDLLIEDLRTGGNHPVAETDQWETLRSKWKDLAADEKATEATWESLWRRTHQLRRRIALENPLAQTGPVVFAKDVPGGAYSSHIVSFHGDTARPGGGVFVLEEPGRSMRLRSLTDGRLPQGAYMHPEVSFDGRRVLFAYCEVDSDPQTYGQFPDRFFHLYSVDAGGGNLTQLTDGPHDDHFPCWLPSGKIIFCSTRRGGFHRCGKGPCPTHTLAICDADGGNPQTVSYHETHEYDPAVLNDGRVLYTRWDYVDRAAVSFQHLWTVKPDGSDVRIFYGNNTLNPMGIWQAQPIPGSSLVMGTACAHHAVPAGSIVLVDVGRGIDGLEPISRFTPEVPFYESEFPVRSRWGGQWPDEISEQLRTIRWPGDCYRSPQPLSEKYCLASYSFDTLRGEPYKNPANLFGLYLVDCFGNKELLYRDMNISSCWPIPLRARDKPPVLPSMLAAEGGAEGTFFVQNVYESWTPLSEERITRLRIVQVLPKTTPDYGDPPPGAALGAPGKQILGTVPVEKDGSAYFRVPARKAVLFQALDEQGRAVQTMYSLTYVQPGERVSCVGCHEHGTTSPSASPSDSAAMALRRPPSAITPGPDGSKPLSYPLLVQPVLDRHCVECHAAEAPKEKSGGVVLTGEPESHFSKSYNALVGHVPFRHSNGPPRTHPGQYGARGSRLTTLLLDGHYDVKLPDGDWESLITWMDANALFYGTFNREDQARQLKGERIQGPELE